LQFKDIDGQRGALVTAVEPGTPAAASGLQTGDRIVAMDGRLLVDSLALKQALAQRQSESAVELRMVREGKLLSAKISQSQTGSKSLATDNPSSGDQQQKSALGGVGALLGGLLGGKGKAEPQDEMALDDEQGVRQVDFETDIDAGDPDRSPDPLSLEALELPPDSEPIELLPPKTDSENPVEQLRKEIAELQRKLKELEENK
jgi:membrane-associated protease RseP (regulator of RpoE activity)